MQSREKGSYQKMVSCFFLCPDADCSRINLSFLICHHNSNHRSQKNNRCESYKQEFKIPLLALKSLTPMAYYFSLFSSFLIQYKFRILTEKFLLHFHSSKIILSAIFFLRQKRRIATTLLFCSEAGARERYSIICCTFSFC